MVSKWQFIQHIAPKRLHLCSRAVDRDASLEGARLSTELQFKTVEFSVWTLPFSSQFLSIKIGSQIPKMSFVAREPSYSTVFIPVNSLPSRRHIFRLPSFKTHLKWFASDSLYSISHQSECISALARLMAMRRLKALALSVCSSNWDWSSEDEGGGISSFLLPPDLNLSIIMSIWRVFLSLFDEEFITMTLLIFTTIAAIEMKWHKKTKEKA